MIKPTVGRVVLVHPFQVPGAHHPDQGVPLAALVAAVHSDSCITVGGFDSSGLPFNAREITLIQDGEEPPVNATYAEWMPYQKGQAAKHDAAEAAPAGIVEKVFGKKKKAA